MMAVMMFLVFLVFYRNYLSILVVVNQLCNCKGKERKIYGGAMDFTRVGVNTYAVTFINVFINTLCKLY